MAEEEEDQTPERREEINRVQMTSGDIVRLIIAAPVVFVWLFLGSRIIISATTSQGVLENIEPLLLALSILTIPVTAILSSLFRVDGNGK